MCEPGATEWDVFEVFECVRAVMVMLTGFSPSERAQALSDISEFFEVMIKMIFLPHEAYKEYAATIAGLQFLEAFLRTKNGRITVLWNRSMFIAEHNEYGAVVITQFRRRMAANRGGLQN